jgi:hypothetical protein
MTGQRTDPDSVGRSSLTRNEKLVGSARRSPGGVEFPRVRADRRRAAFRCSGRGRPCTPGSLATGHAGRCCRSTHRPYSSAVQQHDRTPPRPAVRQNTARSAPLHSDRGAAGRSRRRGIEVSANPVERARSGGVATPSPREPKRSPTVKLSVTRSCRSRASAPGRCIQARCR